MSGLRLGQKIGFGLGCVLNALCAAMWFSYILLYFDQVNFYKKLSERHQSHLKM